MYVEGVPMNNAVVKGEGRNLQFGISVDAVDQFQVVTSGTAVTFNGQGATNFVVKSGTNTLHGSASEYLRNKALDAKAFFAPVKADDNQHEYGGTLGGPIRKNRMFFFAAYGGYRDGRHTQTTPYRGGNNATNPQVALPLPYTETRLVEEIPSSAQVKHTTVLGSNHVNQASVGFSRLSVPIFNATIDGQYPLKAGLRG